MMRILGVAVCAVLACTATATEIVWASDPVRPNETVVALGDGFGEEAVVEVARGIDGDDWRQVEPLQRSERCVKFVVPGEWELGAYAVRVTSGGAVSRTAVLNAPDAWWLQGDRGNAAASPGGWFRVHGKCLNFGGASRLLLTPKAGGPIALTPRESNCYALVTDIPVDAAEGEYAVGVRNGLDEDAEWTPSGRVRIESPAGWKDDVFDVAEYRADAENDTAAIKAALSEAEANGGGIVQIPRGTYAVEETLEMPRFVVLRGEARELVSLRWPDRDEPLPALIHGMNSFAVEDLTLYANNHMHGIEADRGHRDGAGHVRIERVRMRLSRLLGVSGRRFDDWRAEARRREEQPGRVAAIQLGGDNIRIVDCDIHVSCIYTFGTTLALILDRARGAYISGTRIEGPYRTAVIIRGVDGLVIEDSDIQGGCFIGTHHTDGGRFGGQGSLINPACENLYLARNKMHDNVWWDREIIAFDSHGPAGVYVGCATDVDGTRLTIDSAGGYYSTEAWRDGDAGWGSRWKGAAVYVMDGKGAGQYRRVVGGEGSTVEVDRPWLVEPDETSAISIAKFHGRTLLVENEFTDSGNVMWWGGGTDCIMAGNRASRFGCFLSTTGLIYKGLMPNWYCQLLGNEILEGNGSWGGPSKLGTVTYPMPLNPPIYAGPLARCGIHRRNVCHNNSFIDISGATADALVEHCTIRDSSTGITVTSRGEAFPVGVVLRGNELENVANPVSGEALDGALVVE